MAPRASSTSGRAREAPAAAANDDREAFLALLVEVRAKVDARLRRLLDERKRAARKLGPDVLALVESARDLTMRGGKRFRPAMLAAAYRAVDARAPLAAAIDVGAALELLQTYLLIHDDWMDQDDVRRGGPSVHAMLRAHFGVAATGDAAAVLAGDWASALAARVVAGIDAPPPRVSRVSSIFARIEEDAIWGQQIDLAGRGDRLERMIDLKTGSYTVRGPLALGAALAGARADEERVLERYARPLGIAFQLRDDLLGVFGDPAETGKPAGNDVRAGKRNLLWREAVARAAPRDAKRIERTVGRRDADDADVARVVALYASTGARAAVEKRLDALVAQACRALGAGALSPDGARWLRGAASALTSRRS